MATYDDRDWTDEDEKPDDWEATPEYVDKYFPPLPEPPLPPAKD